MPTRRSFWLAALTLLTSLIVAACTSDGTTAETPAFFSGIVVAPAGRTHGNDVLVVDKDWARAITADAAIGKSTTNIFTPGGIATDGVLRAESYGWPLTGTGYVLVREASVDGVTTRTSLRFLTKAAAGVTVATTTGRLDIFGGDLTAAAVVSSETVILLDYPTGATESIAAPTTATHVSQWLGYDANSRVLYGVASVDSTTTTLVAWSLSATSVTDIASLPFLPQHADYDGDRFVLSNGSHVAVAQLKPSVADGTPRALKAVTDSTLFFAPTRVIAAPGGLAHFQAPDGTLHRATATTAKICILHREDPEATESSFLDAPPISSPKLTVTRVGTPDCPGSRPSQAWIASYEIPPVDWRMLQVTATTDRIALAGAAFAVTGDVLLSANEATVATVITIENDTVILSTNVVAGTYSLRPTGRWALSGTLSGLVGTFATGVSVETEALSLRIDDGVDTTTRGDTFTFNTEVLYSGYVPTATVSSVSVNTRLNTLIVTDRISGTVDALDFKTLETKWSLR